MTICDCTVPLLRLNGLIEECYSYVFKTSDHKLCFGAENVTIDPKYCTVDGICITFVPEKVVGRKNIFPIYCPIYCSQTGP